MRGIVNAVEKAVADIANFLDTKIEDVSCDIKGLRNGDYRIKMSFLIKKKSDRKTLDDAKRDTVIKALQDFHDKYGP